MAKSKLERTFIMVKPDGVSRGLVHKVIERFEQRGYKLVAMRMLTPNAELLEEHYADLKKLPFFPTLISFMSSGPVVAMVWEGIDVIAQGRIMIGATNPLSSAPGSIRGTYCIDIGRNIVHGSDGLESAQKEIALWFSPEEIQKWSLSSENAIYE